MISNQYSTWAQVYDKNLAIWLLSHRFPGQVLIESVNGQWCCLFENYECAQILIRKYYDNPMCEDYADSIGKAAVWIDQRTRRLEWGYRQVPEQIFPWQ